MIVHHSRVWRHKRRGLPLFRHGGGSSSRSGSHKISKGEEGRKHDDAPPPARPPKISGLKGVKDTGGVGALGGCH